MGPCPGLQTIGRAALAAVVHVLRDAEPGGIITDCLGVYRKCEAIRMAMITKERLLRGVNADLRVLVWEVLQAGQTWSFEWVPSHKSEEEAIAAGIAQETWHGNGLADEAAKAQARAADIPPQVLAAWAEQQATHRASPGRVGAHRREPGRTLGQATPPAVRSCS